MELTLECQKRVEGSKPNALRREGLIPAVVYGHNGAESIAFTVKAKKVEHLLRDATVNNTLIDLNIPEIPWSGKALLREKFKPILGKTILITSAFLRFRRKIA